MRLYVTNPWQNFLVDTTPPCQIPVTLSDHDSAGFKWNVLWFSIYYENGHDAKGPQAHRMKIEYPGACCNNVGRQGCPNFGTWIPS